MSPFLPSSILSKFVHAPAAKAEVTQLMPVIPDMKLSVPAVHPAGTFMPSTQFVDAAAINLTELNIMVRMLLIISEHLAVLDFLAGQRLVAISINGGIRVKDQKLSATFHAQKTLSIGFSGGCGMSGISWRNLSTKLEAFAASRRSPASAPPCMTVCSREFLGQNRAI